MKKHIIVTGGNGYVGSMLVELLSRQHHVAVIDNLMSGKSLLETGWDEFVYKDIRDEYVTKLIPYADVVVHLAAVVGEPACQVDNNEAYDINVIGTDNIVRSMKQSQRLVFASTTSIYGNKSGQKVTEDTEPSPLGNYGYHKLENEYIIQRLLTDYVILRPVTAFGVTERTRLDVLVNTLIYEALTTGEIKLYEPNIIRPIIHVVDYARILRLAAQREIEPGIYNIGDPKLTMTKQRLADKIAYLTGTKVVAVEGTSLDQRDYDIDFSKIISTGFVFTPNALELAVVEVNKALPELQKDPDSYSAPYRFTEYLKRKGSR